MKVWVVMGNDYPDAVFESEAAAELYCAAKRKEPTSRWGGSFTSGTRIYWRYYDFEVHK